MKGPVRFDFNQSATSIGRTFKNLEVFGSREAFHQWSGSAFADRFFLVFLLMWILPIVIAVGFVVINFGRLPLSVPLFYSRVWGDLQLAKKIYIFVPLLGAFLLGIFNLGIAISFHNRDRVLSYLLSGTATLISLLATITTVNIVLLMR